MSSLKETEGVVSELGAWQDSGTPTQQEIRMACNATNDFSSNF